MLYNQNQTSRSSLSFQLGDLLPLFIIDSGKEVNDKDPKFKVGDLVRISKYKNIFAKGYTANWSEEVVVIKEVKNTVRWIYAY